MRRKKVKAELVGRILRGKVIPHQAQGLRRAWLWGAAAVKKKKKKKKELEEGEEAAAPLTEAERKKRREERRIRHDEKNR